MLATATLPDPSEAKAREVVRLPVVIVETAPAILATLLASIAVASVTPAVSCVCIAELTPSK